MDAEKMNTRQKYHFIPPEGGWGYLVVFGLCCPVVSDSESNNGNVNKYTSINTFLDLFYRIHSIVWTDFR